MISSNQVKNYFGLNHLFYTFILNIVNLTKSFNTFDAVNQLLAWSSY